MTQEQATALLAISVAFGVPISTLILALRRDGREAFKSEAMARIEMLQTQLQECRERYLSLSASIAGGSDNRGTEPIMRRRRKREEKPE